MKVGLTPCRLITHYPFALAVRSKGADCILLLSLVSEIKLHEKGADALYT